jgi:hypothetical protein
MENDSVLQTYVILILVGDAMALPLPETSFIKKGASLQRLF